MNMPSGLCKLVYTLWYYLPAEFKRKIKSARQKLRAQGRNEERKAEIKSARERPTQGFAVVETVQKSIKDKRTLY